MAHVNERDVAALVLVTRMIWLVILAHFLTKFAAYLNSAAGGPISSMVTATDYETTASPSWKSMASTASAILGT